MAEEFELGKAPLITIPVCQGELIVKSWDRLTVQVKAEDAQTDATEDGLTITSNGRLILRVPEFTNLAVQTANGDTIIKNLQGDVTLGVVNGDAILVSLEQATVGTVNGDLSAKHINDSVTAESVHGDAIFRYVGSVSLNEVSGDLSARLINGDVDINTVSGDIGLRQISGDVSIKAGHRDANLRFLDGATHIGNIYGDVRIYGELAVGKHAFQAGGDIILRWPVNTPVNLVANAPKVLNRLPLDEVVQTDQSLTGHIGEDGPVITLNANGRIILKELYAVREEWEERQTGDSDFDFNFDFEELEGLGAQISAQVNEQMARLTAELEGKFGGDFAQRMAEKISLKAERAARRAEQAAERARKRAERHHHRAAPHPPRPPRPPRPRATPEEQLKILKMVEQGVISPEEANTLLEALENK
ncbi:MAG: hypothetical protein H6662_14040 [Ardenticatenaceae bacterium]|nr:hypothetical protein [Anaerolineales bacterium]MCB8922703.1 hypothetical protein [Ardenticatenaceae bacterium]MCB8991748.1 hypothetical protein [Ardenticatenaceae bacterium]MCB9003589.1 hypothetical protein [Ardenticatenaceae bacterium]